MIVTDRIYGKVKIEEPVLLELIHSQPVQRLKKINQAGASQYLFTWKDVSRYEHCIGVMLLLYKFGASLDEQIAGLLHDVPHTAFSHVIDFVFENKNHEFHEQFHEQIIADSEIKQILSKYKIPANVAHPENFSLLERKIPDLCADRIDYALRDLFIYNHDLESVRAKLNGLKVVDNEFIFANIYAAESFARDYLSQDKHAWSDPRESALYMILAQAIRHALDKNILNIKDLFTDDAEVYQILQKHGDAYIQKKLGFMTPAFRIEPASLNHYHLFIKTKIRHVDPKVLSNGKLTRVSQISPKYKAQMENHLKEGNQGWYVLVYAK